MTFKKLSEYFQRLESVSSRNLMVEILAELFKQASANEIDKITYLLQGRVAPLYEPVEFGMAEKYVIKAMALAYNIPVEKVTADFKKSGDLGEVAEKYGDSGRGQNDVVQVFEKLQQITQVSGEGSAEKKVEILANLLKDSDPPSAKYIARTPVDKLRLGFSDMTILEALSWMIDGTKKHKDQIEAAYNIRPDLGTLAASVKQLGIRGLEKIGPKVGTPILVMRAERLTNTKEILEKAGPTSLAKGELRGVNAVAVEPKLDGLRTQLHFSRTLLGKQGESFLRLYSRGMENVTAMYPDIVAAAINELGVRGQGSGVRIDEVILDGEAIGFDPGTGKYLPFQETVQRKRKYDIQAFSENVPVKLIVFDVLYLNGKSLIDEPYTKRREKVERLLGSKEERKILVPVKMTVVERPEELEKIFNESLKKGLEGIMAKRLDGVYQAGARGWNWIKLKGSYLPAGRQVRPGLLDTIDAVVMGLDFGQGKRNKFGVGAFLIGIYDDKSDTYKTVSKVGTGLTDVEWKQLAASSKRLVTREKPQNYDVNKLMDCDVWLKPAIVGEFRADELTKSPMHTAGYALRFPRLVAWREKKPEDTTSLKEILEIVGLQKR